MYSYAAVPLSCSECKRRKQKCNREFPCEHCLKRGVSHRCKFEWKPVRPRCSKEMLSLDGQPSASRKRSFDGRANGALSNGGPGHDDDDSCSDIDVSSILTGMGYMSYHHHLVLGLGHGTKAGREPVEKDGEQSEELKAALALMPEKRYTDCLVDNWLNGANYQYYALYPPEFRTQYSGWWATPRDKVTAELTSLILRVCACSLQFIVEDSVRARLEAEFDMDLLTLASRLHVAAERLSASIPPGKGGLVHVQQLFLTAFWFKSAEKLTEAWHALSKAIRAANEIGLHQDSLSDAMSEFDREMRRRIWVILYLWDFALSAMLSRPLLVNHADCTIVLPTLTLESNPFRPDQPSPFRHMNLHCQLCIDMAAQLGNRSNSDEDKAEMANRTRKVVDAWFERLPAEYAVTTPDTRWDGEFKWVVFQRRYLHVIGYMSLFSQLRPFITRSSATPMSNLKSHLREEGVGAALCLMDASWRLLENLASVGAKAHNATFCIFDAATVTCFGLLHDEARNLPKREAVLEAVTKTLSMLAEVAAESKTTAALHRILKVLLTKLPLSRREQGMVDALKRVKHGRKTPPSDNISVAKPPSKSPARSAPRDVRRRHGPRPGYSSASPDSDSTTDSQSPQPYSERSVSLPRSCRPISPKVPSSFQAGPRSVVPSNGAARVDGLPSCSTLVSLAPLHPSYAGTAESLMPATSSMSITIFNGYPPPPSPAFVETADFQYSSALSPVDAVPFSQPRWQPSPVSVNGLGSDVPAYQTANLAEFGNSTPEALGCWEWPNLGLSHPVSWEQSSAHVQNQSGTQHHHGLLRELNGRGVARGGGDSSSTDGPSR